MKSFREFHEEREELDESSVADAAQYFFQFHRKNMNKRIDRNLWTVSRMLGMKYRDIENELKRQAARYAIPKDLEPEVRKLLRLKDKAIFKR